jgi:hypothetical protein
MKLLLTFVLSILTSINLAAKNKSEFYGVSIYSFGQSENIDDSNKSQKETEEWLKKNYKNAAKKICFQSVLITNEIEEGESVLYSLKEQDIPTEIKEKIEKSKIKKIGIKSEISLRRQKDSNALFAKIDYRQCRFKKFLKYSEDSICPIYDEKEVKTTLVLNLAESYIIAGYYFTDKRKKMRYLNYLLLVVEKLDIK